MSLRWVALISLFTCGWMLLTYAAYASAQGMRVGAFFRTDNAVLIGGTTALAAMIAASIAIVWWAFAVVAVSGIATCFVLVLVLRSWAQMVAFVGLPVSALVAIFSLI